MVVAKINSLKLIWISKKGAIYLQDLKQTTPLQAILVYAAAMALVRFNSKLIQLLPNLAKQLNLEAK